MKKVGGIISCQDQDLGRIAGGNLPGGRTGGAWGYEGQVAGTATASQVSARDGSAARAGHIRLAARAGNNTFVSTVTMGASRHLGHEGGRTSSRQRKNGAADYGPYKATAGGGHFHLDKLISMSIPEVKAFWGNQEKGMRLELLQAIAKPRLRLKCHSERSEESRIYEILRSLRSSE